MQTRWVVLAALVAAVCVVTACEGAAVPTGPAGRQVKARSAQFDFSPVYCNDCGTGGWLPTDQRDTLAYEACPTDPPYYEATGECPIIPPGDD